MSIYAIGDLHLSFASHKPMDVYGPDWENHFLRVKDEWERRVGDEDTVIIPGDISWALKLSEAKPDLDWIHELPGNKIMIRGNHDLWWGSIGRLNTMYDDVRFLQNTHCEADGTAICGSRGWILPEDEGFSEKDEKIYRRELIRMELSLTSAKNAGLDDIIVAIHYPPATRDKADSDFTRLFQSYGVKKVVYGHLHGEDSYMKGISGTYGGAEYSLISLDYLKCKPMKIWG